MKMACPSYFYPDNVKWPALLSKSPAITVINPGSGPGNQVDVNYSAQIAKAQSAGSKVLGYVTLDYLTRTFAAIQADIDKFYAWYPTIDGIFLDECDNSASPVSLTRCQTMFNYIKSKAAMQNPPRSGTVVINPGTSIGEPYMPFCDHAMDFESQATNYRTRTVEAWRAKYPGKFWHCVHTASESELAEMLLLAIKHSAGLFWCTNDIMPNPYDTVPVYLNKLAEGIALVTAPTPIPVPVPVPVPVPITLTGDIVVNLVFNGVPIKGTIKAG